MSELVATSPEKEKTVNIMNFITEGKNPRGIPTAKFIESVEAFLEEHPVETALGALNELYSKYKYMEQSFEKSKSVYKSKIPDIEQTLELIRLLKSKEEEGEDLITNYSLSDTIYSKAKVETTNGKVHLWIGANTMVEFAYTEAIELLQEQLENSILKLQELDEDLYHLRGSSITVEVNMARLFNHNVKVKKLKEAATASSASSSAVAGTSS